MKITLEIPNRTAAAVITLLVDEIAQYTMTTKTFGTDMLKDGAEVKFVLYKQQKEGESE